MEQTSYVFSFCFLVLLFAVSVQPDQVETTAATTVIQPTTRTPPSTQEIPASPVSYNFAGDEGEKVCLILTPQTTAVIRACSSNADVKFSTNLSPSVPINLVQTRDASMMCQLLIITTRIDKLQEGAFDVFYDSSSLQIKYGPLRFSNPNGDRVLPFGNGVTEVVLRYRAVDRTRTEFKVCRNGTLADFVVTLRRPSDCRLGDGAGGFSSHFDAIVSDIGQDPLSGENFTITSGPCNNTAAGISFNFSVPDKVFSSTLIIPSTSSLTQSPTSAIISTMSSIISSSSSVAVTPEYTKPTVVPTSLTPAPGHSNIIVITVPVVIGFVVLLIGVVISLPLTKKCILKEIGKRVEETRKRVEKNSIKVEETSKKVEDTSIKMEETSKKVKENSTIVQETSIKMEEASKEVRENSIKVEEAGKKVEENSIKIERHSIKIGKTIAQVEENTAQVEDNTKQLDELKDTVFENILSEQEDEETEVDFTQGSNHTH